MGEPGGGLISMSDSVFYMIPYLGSITGAGDGEVTKIMASYFSKTFATEMSPPMRKQLAIKQFQSVFFFLLSS